MMHPLIFALYPIKIAALQKLFVFLKGKERYPAMFELKEQLSAKNKDCLERLYRKVKGYAALQNLQPGVCGSARKEERIDWLASMMARKEILQSIVSDQRAGEAAYMSYVYESGGFGEYVARSPYWEETGLIYAVTDHEGAVHGVMTQELMAFLREGGAALMAQANAASFVNSAVCAMTNLYGAVSYAKAYDIFQEVAVLHRKIPYETFVETAVRFAQFREDSGIVTYQKNFVASEYLDVRVRSGIRRISPLPSYYELISKQGDKPYFTDLSVRILLDYEFPGSCEPNVYIGEFTEFLCNTFGKHKTELSGIMGELCRACREERGINEIFGMLTDAGYAPPSQKAQKTMVRHIMEIKNNVRLRINRGYTINEMRGICYDANAICSNL